MRVTLETREATRTKLLEAAAEEFGRVGLDRANVDAISTRAGFAKGTIYNYFPSKQDLFQAVIEWATAQAIAAAHAAPDASTRERIVATIEGFCDWVREHDSFARVLVRECLMETPSLHSGVIRSEEPLIHELQSILDGAPRTGEVRDDVPSDLLGLAIAGLTDLALAYHWASNGAVPTLDEIPELVATLLLGRPVGAEARSSRFAGALKRPVNDDIQGGDTDE
jgi:AcrR family transcriptional regulator